MKIVIIGQEKEKNFFEKKKKEKIKKFSALKCIELI